jgi:uncharacterized protein YodC (DUF2158 family)
MVKTAFRVGETVRLKSGGPEMTVAAIGRLNLRTRRTVIACRWFVGSKLERESFYSEAIEHIKPNQESNA